MYESGWYRVLNVPGMGMFFLCLGVEKEMEKRSSQQIRQLFLEYFRSKNHMVEPGAPLVPIDDDTLLWINSGVAALKKYFDGSTKPKNPRIVNVQKSIRTNDIENVGYTARHHTFFEMLGNFSIGDYFKKEAIEFAYEFLFSKDWVGLDPNHLYVSVHTDDKEAYDIWVNHIGLDPKRILKTDDNFWQIGNGPCGPNSELFYDRGEKYDPENIGERLFFEDLENDRYIEVWNVVFSQYDGVEGGDISSFKELPQKNIDTGMGFERLVSIVQDGDTNFDTDLFLPIIERVEKISNQTYKENTMAYRVISDHIRTLVFALNDGAMFSNEGRGYVLRRILRRAVRFGKVIGIEEAFLYTLVDVVIDNMKDFYPNLLDRPEEIKKLILNEEKRFAKTLMGGEKLLLEQIEKSDGKHLPGDVAFKLYDTYGFPIELTQEIAQEKGIEVDLEGFKQELENQKNRARRARQHTESMESQNEDILNFDVPSEFLYDTLHTTTTITGLFQDGKRVSSFVGEGLVATEETPFYAESGGQVSDTGFITNGVVKNVSKANAGQHLHHVVVESALTQGDVVTLEVDRNRRVLIRKNHSAVHLLHAALHQLVGNSVNQAGSYVDDAYFRFDFTHIERLDEKTLQEIEELVNTWIAQSLDITTDIMDVESAKETGAMALFSDVYGDLVRVVSMGDVSKELCGGTHALNTGEIGVFKLVSEESVGSGIRRIVGKTSVGAYYEMDKANQALKAMRQYLKLAPQKTIQDRLVEMEEEIEKLNQSLQHFTKEMLETKKATWLNNIQTTQDNLKVLWLVEEDLDKDMTNHIVDSLKDRVDILMLVNKKETGLNYVVSSSEKAINLGYKAGDLARLLAQKTGGNGGGRPNFAQAGGKDITKLDAAYDEICVKIKL